MVPETHMKLCVTAEFYGNFFAPKIGKMDQKMDQKQSFLNFQRNLVIPYLGKFLFQRYWPKCSQPIRLEDALITISPEQLSEIA